MIFSTTLLESQKLNLESARNLLQRDHVYGCELRGDHHHGPQLPPQAGGDPRDAGVGEDNLPPMGALAAEDEQTRGEDHKENYPGDAAQTFLLPASG